MSKQRESALPDQPERPGRHRPQRAQRHARGGVHRLPAYEDRAQPYEARQQQHEGQEEVPKNKGDSEIAPGSLESFDVPGNLFRQVARPHDQQL